MDGAARGDRFVALLGAPRSAGWVSGSVLAALLLEGRFLDRGATGASPDHRRRTGQTGLHRSARRRDTTAPLRAEAINALVAAMAPPAEVLHRPMQYRDRARYAAEATVLLDAVVGWAGLVRVDTVYTGGERWMYTDRNDDQA